jgi:hypothetical protein
MPFVCIWLICFLLTTDGSSGSDRNNSEVEPKPKPKPVPRKDPPPKLRPSPPVTAPTSNTQNVRFSNLSKFVGMLLSYVTSVLIIKFDIDDIIIVNDCRDRENRKRAILMRSGLLRQENGFKRTTKKLKMVEFLFLYISII